MNKSDITASLTFTTPLTLEMHNVAQKYSQKQFTLEKVQQVYQNTLAVQAVDFYLGCMGWETDWTHSDSHDPMMQTFTDVADLDVKNYGKLECRPVLSDAEVCYVPPDVWEDRIGYVVVDLNKSLTKATILGFASTVVESKGVLPIDELRSLAEFPDYLSQTKQPNPIHKAVVILSQWFKGIVEPGWQSLEEFLGTTSANLVPVREDFQESTIQKIKLIDLGIQLQSQSLELLVGIKPEADDKVGIRVQLRPYRENYLPPNLKLTLLSPSGETIQEVESRNQDNYIQLKRWKSPQGKRFKLQVALNDSSLIEDFEV